MSTISLGFICDHIFPNICVIHTLFLQVNSIRLCLLSISGITIMSIMAQFRMSLCPLGFPCLVLFGSHDSRMWTNYLKAFWFYSFCLIKFDLQTLQPIFLFSDIILQAQNLLFLFIALISLLTIFILFIYCFFSIYFHVFSFSLWSILMPVISHQWLASYSNGQELLKPFSSWHLLVKLKFSYATASAFSSFQTGLLSVLN